MGKKEYSSISPSAVSLIRLKALTNIPFAKETADFLHKQPDALYPPSQQMDRAELFRLLLHFENRYYSIEKILSRIPSKNIIEISSGYSFRGLDICLRQPVNFIDTDLEGIMTIKKQIAATILPKIEKDFKGTIEFSILNAMDEDAFINIIDRFPQGPITIINEGLLVYLNDEEKRSLCTTIHKILKQRGGYWITGDIYVKREEKPETHIPHHQFSAFRKEHRIDENKFKDFATAEKLFSDCGLEIIYRESLAIEYLSSLNLVPDKKEAIIAQLKNAGPSRETWCLQAR